MAGRFRGLAAGSAALLAAAITLTGCGSSQSGSGGTQADGMTTVTISTWYLSEFQPVLDTANELLKPDNIRLEAHQIPLDQYNTWLSTQISSGSGPDLIMDEGNFPARVRAGNLLEVTGRDVLAAYSDTALRLATDGDGKVYGVPTWGWLSGYYYNVDLFAQHGVEVPKTFDELIAACKKFQAAGVTPIGMGLAGSDKGLHSLLGYLENVFYHNGSESPEFDVDFAFKKKSLSGNWDAHVEKWTTLITEGIITPEFLGQAEQQTKEAFMAGKAAMVLSGPWDYHEFKDAGLNFGVFSHLGDSPEKQYLLGGSAANVGVNRDSKQQEAALKAFDVIAGPEVQKALLAAYPGAFSYAGAEADVPEEYALVADILRERRVDVPWNRWSANMPAHALIDESVKQLQGLIAGTSDVTQFVKSLDAFADSIRF